MSKIAFAWELGANYGHLSRSLPIAEHLRGQSHEILFVVRDVTLTHSILGPKGIPFIAAPRCQLSMRPGHSPINYGQLLAECGYAHRPTLRSLLSAWISLWRLVRPAAIVIDHSPTALLAARVLELPVMLLGNGFTIPPDVDPLPSIRPWEPATPDELHKSDDFILGNINDALQSFDHPPLSRIADLFAGLPSQITTFVELDHYGERAKANFIGPIGSESDQRVVRWSREQGPRIFAYLRADIPGLGPLMSALKESDAEVICVIPDAPLALLEKLQAPDFRVYTHPVELTSLLPGANVCVSYGGVGLTATALIAGVPLLLVPQFIEQHMAARRVATLGAGIVIDRRRAKADFAQALGQLMTLPDYTESARTLARKFSPFNSEAATASAANAIAALAALGIGAGP